MSQRIAEEDLTEVNGLGQTVVVVPKGQRIPEGFDSARTGLRTTEAAANGISDAPPASPPPDQLNPEEFAKQLADVGDDDLAVLGEALAGEFLERGGVLPADLPGGVIAGETPGWPTDDDGKLLKLPSAERWEAIVGALSDAKTEVEETQEKLAAAEKRAEDAEAAAAEAAKTSKTSKGKKAK